MSIHGFGGLGRGRWRRVVVLRPVGGGEHRETTLGQTAGDAQARVLPELLRERGRIMREQDDVEVHTADRGRFRWSTTTMMMMMMIGAVRMALALLPLLLLREHDKVDEPNVERGV